MLSSCAAALKLSCSATARNVRSWCSVRALSSARVSAITESRSTIGQVTAAPPPHPAARERIDALLDPGSLFELDAAARLAGDGVVGGVGTVDGRDVAVYALGP